MALSQKADYFIIFKVTLANVGKFSYFFSLVNSEKICKRNWNKSTISFQIFCRTTLRKVIVQLYNLTLIFYISRNNMCFML